MDSEIRSIAMRDLKARLSAVIDHVQLGHSVVLTLRGKPIARIEPLNAADSTTAVEGVVWRGSGRKLGLHAPAIPIGEGTSISELLLAQRL